MHTALQSRLEDIPLIGIHRRRRFGLLLEDLLSLIFLSSFSPFIFSFPFFFYSSLLYPLFGEMWITTKGPRSRCDEEVLRFGFFSLSRNGMANKGGRLLSLGKQERMENSS